jgi:hypothetical protein
MKEMGSLDESRSLEGRAIRRAWEKGTCPLCRGNELAYKKIANCTNEAHIIHLGKYLDKLKHKWESRVRKE